MANLKAKFYKYHRELGIIFSLPLALWFPLKKRMLTKNYKKIV